MYKAACFFFVFLWTTCPPPLFIYCCARPTHFPSLSTFHHLPLDRSIHLPRAEDRHGRGLLQARTRADQGKRLPHRAAGACDPPREDVRARAPPRHRPVLQRGHPCARQGRWLHLAGEKRRALMIKACKGVQVVTIINISESIFHKNTRVSERRKGKKDRCVRT